MFYYIDLVGEHFKCCEGRFVRTTGALGRENADMSNHKHDENSCPRKSKVSVAMEVSHGVGDPKAMVKTAADGQPVNIPALYYNVRWGDGGNKWEGINGYSLIGVKSCALGKSGALPFMVKFGL